MAEVLDAQTRVDDLLFIAGHLIDVLQQENVALAHNRMDLMHELVEQKVKLSRAYEIRVLGLSKAPDSLNGVEPALVEELKSQASRLEELVEVNARELSIGIETGQRFMDVLSDSVKTATPTAGTYGATGATGTSALPKNAKTASLAIDEQL